MPGPERQDQSPGHDFPPTVHEKITYTGHLYGFNCEMALLLVAMKERGFLHPMLELNIRLHYAGSHNGETYHSCRPWLIDQDLYDQFDQIGKALGRDKDMTTAKWEQAEAQWVSIAREEGESCECDCRPYLS